MAVIPASIRYNNPGAQWDGKVAKKWGSTQTVTLADGQSNHIAVFPTAVQGASAQFDLWKTSYCNLTLDGAIRKWSGGNSSPQYMAFLVKQTGIQSTDRITTALLSSGKGLALMKAQAQWEAGKAYPMTDGQWAQAQSKVFKPSVVSTGTTTAVVVAGGAVATKMSVTDHAWMWLHSHWGYLLIGVVASAAIGLAIDYYIHRKAQ